MKIDRLRNHRGQIWLNVASSTHVLENFINLDNHIFLQLSRAPRIAKLLLPGKYHERIDEYRSAGQAGVLVKHDCRKGLSFPVCSVDHILCSHFLEHVYPTEAHHIVADFARVLKSGGTVHLIVPDLKGLAINYVAKSDSGLRSAADDFMRDSLLSREQRGSLKYRLLEFHGGFGLQHRWMYDQLSLSQLAQEVGFEIVKCNETPSRAYRADDGSVHVVGIKP